MNQAFDFCVIMVVKDEEEHIYQSVESALQRPNVVVYLVNDNSSDDTLKIVFELKSIFPGRVLLSCNPYAGKVEAYKSIKDLPVSDFYFFLDGDDFYSEAWLDFEDELQRDVLYYHDLKTYFSDGRGSVIVNPAVHSIPKNLLLRKPTLLPKASWIVPRNLIHHFLDIPSGVEFEDIWFSLISYTRASEIRKVPLVWYMYRQHDRQVFGRQDAGGQELVKFRTGRVQRSLGAIRHERPEFSELLRDSYRRYCVLSSMNAYEILKKLGPVEALLFAVQIMSPRLLVSVKRLLRRRT